jgi:hypothetical protein
LLRFAKHERDLTMTKRNQHIGSSLNKFLAGERILEETRAIAIQDAAIWQAQRTVRTKPQPAEPPPASSKT